VEWGVGPSLVPVTVISEDPGSIEPVTVSVEEPELVSESGLKAAVAPVGSPSTASVTVPLKPGEEKTETV